MLTAFPTSSEGRLLEALERTISTRIQTARSKRHLLLVTTDRKVGNAHAEPKTTTEHLSDDWNGTQRTNSHNAVQETEQAPGGVVEVRLPVG